MKIAEDIEKLLENAQKQQQAVRQKNLAEKLAEAKAAGVDESTVTLIEEGLRAAETWANQMFAVMAQNITKYLNQLVASIQASNTTLENNDLRLAENCRQVGNLAQKAAEEVVGIQRRIIALEENAMSDKVERLEKRVAELEAQLRPKAEQAPIEEDDTASFFSKGALAMVAGGGAIGAGLAGFEWGIVGMVAGLLFDAYTHRRRNARRALG